MIYERYGSTDHPFAIRDETLVAHREIAEPWQDDVVVEAHRTISFGADLAAWADVISSLIFGPAINRTARSVPEIIPLRGDATAPARFTLSCRGGRDRPPHRVLAIPQRAHEFHGTRQAGGPLGVRGAPASPQAGN